MKTICELIPSKLSLTLVIALGTASAALAQGELGVGSISGSGSGPYTYSLTFSDQSGASSPIGSIWYGWVPGDFYLPSAPSSPITPTGWTATVQSDSIKFVASSSLYDITAGNSLSGFGYTASFSPSQLAADPNASDSYAYSGAIQGDAGEEFHVQIAPEPSSLGLMAVGVLSLALVCGRKLRCV